MLPALGLAVGSKAGLIVTVLFIVFAKTEAAQIANLTPRKRGGGDEPDDSSDPNGDDDDSTTKCVNNICLVCLKQTCITVTSTPPATSTPTSTLTRPITSQTGTLSTPPPTTPNATPSSTPSATKSGDLSLNSQLPITIQNHRRVAVGSIVGGVLGSLVALGLILMVIHKFLARKRKARKRPSGFVPASYFNVSNAGDNARSLHDPEMSQTQSSPLISTAMAAAHVASHRSTAPSSAYSLASPLSVSILSNASPTPHRNLSTSVSASTSSHRRASLSETVASSQWPHEPLLNPYEMPPPAWSISNPNSTSTATEITSPSPTLSRESHFPTTPFALVSNLHSSVPPAPPGDTNLLRSMTAFQKALEADGEKPLVDDSSSSAAGSSAPVSDIKKDNQYDPPPQYRD